LRFDYAATGKFFDSLGCKLHVGTGLIELTAYTHVFNKRIRTALICAVLSCLSPLHFADASRLPSVDPQTKGFADTAGQ
jgi:hypothetical protein